MSLKRQQINILEVVNAVMVPKMSKPEIMSSRVTHQGDNADSLGE